jgi:hypothetical protein
METSGEKPKIFTEQAVERLSRLNSELFGDEVIIIDATKRVPHEIEPPATPENHAA